MSVINGTNSANSATTGSTSTKSKSNTLNQDMFLKMLTAQMQYQDPTKPQDTSAFMNQLTQMTMVSAMSELQTSFASLRSDQSYSQWLQASGLIGHSVMIQTDKFELEKGQETNAQAALTKDATDVKITIYDADGKPVRTIDMGDKKAGVLDFSWDGLKDDGTPAGEGKYSLKVEAVVDGKTTELKTRVATQVDSVTMSNGGVLLNLRNGQQASLTDIDKIF